MLLFLFSKQFLNIIRDKNKLETYFNLYMLKQEDED